MANPKKSKKILVFSIIAVVLVALALVAIFKKKVPPVTVQTEKVARRNITETVVANGKIYPVAAGPHQPGGQRRNHRAAGQGRPVCPQGRFAVEDQSRCLYRRAEPGQGRLRIVAGREDDRRGESRKGRGGLQAQQGIVRHANCFRNRTSSGSRSRAMWPRRRSKAPTTR